MKWLVFLLMSPSTFGADGPVRSPSYYYGDTDWEYRAQLRAKKRIEQETIAQIRDLQEANQAIERAKAREVELIEEARRAPSPNLTFLLQNLLTSFHGMAKATPEPTKQVYLKARDVLLKQPTEPSLQGTMEGMCAMKLVLEITKPVIKSTTSKIFKDAIDDAEELERILSTANGENCSYMQTERSAFSIKTLLGFLRTGLDALDAVTSTQSIELTSLKARLNAAESALVDPGFPASLKDFLNSQDDSKNLLKTFYHHPKIVGIAIMMETIEDRLRAFIEDGRGIRSKAETLDLGIGLSISPTNPIIDAAVFNIGDRVNARLNEPKRKKIQQEMPKSEGMPLPEEGASDCYCEESNGDYRLLRSGLKFSVVIKPYLFRSTCIHLKEHSPWCGPLLIYQNPEGKECVRPDAPIDTWEFQTVYYRAEVG